MAAHEQAKPVVLAVVRDLFFGNRIAHAAEALGARVVFVRQRADLPRLVAEHRPRALLLDLAAPGWTWADDLPAARAAAGGPLYILAFGPHAQADLLRAARAAGCERVVANSKLAAALPTLLAAALRGGSSTPAEPHSADL
ncbi:MAG: hypothetical protein HY691_13730 [Chloroflexi bacterium]|nr:hypothetical protein [Chloroflexota bacterium]